MNIESVVLLAVIGLVIYIDRFFYRNKRIDVSKLIEGLPEKNYKAKFSFTKSLIINCFPLILILTGLFINDDLNLSIYNLTGFTYWPIVSWLTIFYYVTFFSYQSLTSSKNKDKLVATEILYFFTIVLLAVLMHFSTLVKQNSLDRLVISSKSEDLVADCFMNGNLFEKKPDNRDRLIRNPGYWPGRNAQGRLLRGTPPSTDFYCDRYFLLAQGRLQPLPKLDEASA